MASGGSLALVMWSTAPRRSTIPRIRATTMDHTVRCFQDYLNKSACQSATFDIWDGNGEGEEVLWSEDGEFESAEWSELIGRKCFGLKAGESCDIEVTS